MSMKIDLNINSIQTKPDIQTSKPNDINIKT